MRRRRNLVIMLVLAAAVVLLAAAATVAAAGETGASPAALAEPASSPTATPAIALVASPATVTAGDAATLAIRITGIPGATLQLSRKVAGTVDFRLVGQLVTNAAGAATYRALPRATTTYRVDYVGDGVQWLPASAEVTVSVRPRVKLFASARVYRGDRARLSVAVGPTHAGATVMVQRRQDGEWAEWRTLRLGAGSRAHVVWRPDSLGAWPLRVVMPADDVHLEGRSRVGKVIVVEPNPYDVPVDAKGIIVVDISQYRLHFFSYGRELRSFPCVTGRPSLPTPIGHFSIYARGMWPGGPYGARIMSYHPPCAIHGTNEPGLLNRFPRNFSHGCTRLANANAIWLYDHAPLGTPVWNVR
jgi:lipoprotein-anchoring transpeptidase ErfK/SrfK